MASESLHWCSPPPQIPHPLLLVVVAVIGILVSILLPSLSNARYKAKLAVCKSNLAQICRINMSYATNNNHNFPWRGAADDISLGTPHTVSWHRSRARTPTDDRQLWLDMGYWNFGCPLSSKKLPFNIDPSHRQSRLLYSYSVFYGWRVNKDLKYTNRNVPMKWRGEEVNIAASDIMHVRRNYGYTITSHEGEFQRANRYIKLNNLVKPYAAVRQDMNFARQDGSVFMYHKVKHLDNRMKKLPYEKTGERR